MCLFFIIYLQFIYYTVYNTYWQNIKSKKILRMYKLFLIK